jgi:Flp pilus assembly protein TadG
MRYTLRPKRLACERGSALAELSVALPLLILIMLGAVDFARVWVQSTAIENAAHAGAQYGAQTTGHAADSSGIYSAVMDGLNASAVAAETFTVASEQYCECENLVAVDCDGGTCATGGVHMYVRVRVNSTFETLFDYPGIPHEIDVSREARIRAR